MTTSTHKTHTPSLAYHDDTIKTFRGCSLEAALMPWKKTQRQTLPWAPTTPAPMLSPQLLHKPSVVAMDMRYTTAVTVTTPSELDIARSKATALTAQELAHIMTTPRQAAHAMATGRGTREHWVCLCTALGVSRAIEHGGVVRGLSGHLDDIERTLKTLATRAGEDDHPPTWHAPALRFDEMDAIRLLVDLHAHQLAQLSYAEYRAAWRLTVARVLSSEGELINAEALEGLES